MTRAILTCFHSYTPFGTEFYEPLLNHYLKQMKKYASEYDMIYLLEDDNWKIDSKKLAGMKAKIIHVEASLRYYDAYKAALPFISEDLVLLLDDDSVIYKPSIIDEVFLPLESDAGARGEIPFDVVSIFDTIGTFKTDKLGGKNKLCPYLFATRKNLLMKYLEIDWAPDMPYCETLGHLTEAMLNDDLRIYEFPEDKSNIVFDPRENETAITFDLNNEKIKSKDTGFYHVRGGSTVAYLLATKRYGDKKTYDDYLKNQPKTELLRHCCWYQYMGGDPLAIVIDLQVPPYLFKEYYTKFLDYHGL